MAMGFKVSPKDRVTYQGKPLISEKLVYILLNKPKDYITTTDDPKQRKTVMALVKNACKERIVPVAEELLAVLKEYLVFREEFSPHFSACVCADFDAWCRSPFLNRSDATAFVLFIFVLY